MAETKECEAFELMVRRIDPRCKLLRTWALQGGVSAQTTALEILLSNGQTQKMVVRQHGNVDIKQKPRVASNEFKLLHILKSVGLPTPMPYYCDESNEILSGPYIVIEYIEGQSGVGYTPSNFSCLVSQLADCLADIHNVECSKLDLSFLPKQEDVSGKIIAERPSEVDETLAEGEIRDTLESAWTFSQRNKRVLLHGDFWTGNTLWRDEQLVSVIDWEDAATGDPLADLANARLEILWAFGVEAMDRFTHQYESKMATVDLTNLPYWDLYAALRPIAKISEWGLDKTTERQMRDRHKWFVQQAFDVLTRQ
jgi:aminoglycoside phosphotransferase (APT) family kinase protein